MNINILNIAAVFACFILMKLLSEFMGGFAVPVAIIITGVILGALRVIT